MRKNLSNRIAYLMCGTALVAISASTAVAQNENVVITGTSIRGQAPIGANVISVDRAAIEATGAQTTQQLLSTIPQLSDFASSAQGNLNTGGRNNSGPDGAGNQTPTIHSLGSSTSSSTLILIDGHRLPTTGLTHNLVDASIIPPNAIQNVEVLPDGASAIYGSDAVAGVINFHTRKDYTGWETTVQGTYADHYAGFNFGQVFGHAWEDGGVVAAYSYSSRSNVMARDRHFITSRQDLRFGAADPSSLLADPTLVDPANYLNLLPGQPLISAGGNFRNFTSCPTAVIATSTASRTPGYVYPYTSGDIVHRQATRDTSQGTAASADGPGVGICDTDDLSSALPSELRNQALVSIRQALNDRMQALVDVVYSVRIGTERSARGGVSNVTVFRSGGTGGPAFGTGQINPFFVQVPGSTANTEFVSIGLDDLLEGYGNNDARSTKTGQITAMATAGIDYDLGGDWLLSLGGTTGSDYSFQRVNGAVNTNEVILALNGTIVTTGAAANSATSSNIVDPYGLSTVVSTTRVLTSANALDVWRPKETNRTSPSVLRSLVDSATSQDSIQQMQTIGLHVDGPLWDIFGAGDMKAALGGEWIHYTWNQRLTSGGSGPASTSSRFRPFDYQRSVYAAFAEVVIPVISADMDVPLIQNLTFDFAARYDHYNDFGDTKNPKISMNWDIIDGIRASASMGSSFTAPPLSAVGAGGSGVSSATNVGTGGAQNGLIVLFNDTRPFNGGAGIAGTFVSNYYACLAANSVPVTASGTTAASEATAVGCRNDRTNSPGLTVAGANATLKPQIGLTYSANLLIDAGLLHDWFRGLTVQFSYYQARINGLITNVNIQTSQTVPGLPYLTSFGPANGCVSAASLCGAGQANQPGWAPTDPLIQSILVGRPLNNPLPVRVYSIGSSQVQNALNLWQNGLDFSASYRFSTDDYGDFSFTLSGNEILRFTQQNAGGTPPFDIKNGKNGGRFVGQELTGSLSVNWHMEPFSVGVRFNHQSPWNDAMTTFPYNLAGVHRLANTQHIGALETVGLNFSYALPEEWLSGSQISVNVTDLFNSFGPFENISDGIATGSAIGRQISVSLRKKW